MTTAEFNLFHPPEAGCKKKVLPVSVFIHFLPAGPAVRLNRNIVRLSGALRKAHAVLRCHAKWTHCSLDLNSVHCAPITGSSGRKVEF